MSDGVLFHRAWHLARERRSILEGNEKQLWMEILLVKNPPYNEPQKMEDHNKISKTE